MLSLCGTHFYIMSILSSRNVLSKGHFHLGGQLTFTKIILCYNYVDIIFSLYPRIIKAWTKWPKLCSRHLQMYFLKTCFINCFQGFDWRYNTIALGNALLWHHNRPDGVSIHQWLFTQPFIQAQIKENTKAPRHRHLCWEFTGDRWIPRTNGQYRGKCFDLMTL